MSLKSRIKKCILGTFYLIFPDVLNDNIRNKAQLEYFMENADICSMKKAKGYFRKRQLDNTDFAKKVLEFLEPLDIHPFLCAGSLIGAIRHKGFIPWDDDLDFAVMRNEYIKIINFFEERNAIFIPDDGIKEYSSRIHLTRMEQALRKFPEQFFLGIFHNQVQINYGTSLLDRMSFDIFPLDYFDEDYSFADHKVYLETINDKLNNSNSIREFVCFITNEVQNNPNISLERTSNVYLGIETWGGYHWKDRINRWIPEDMIFPLKEGNFEDLQFNIPSNSREFADLCYGDIMNFPNDVGVSPHMGYTEEFIYDNYVTVEFYLIDAFEIYHFLPLYRIFEKNGIYVKFIAEKPEINITGTWFDFNEAVRIMNETQVRYSSVINRNATAAFTTQRSYVLAKYSKRTKKIRMCYGDALFKQSFARKETYDILLVPGNRRFEYFSKLNHPAKLMKIGYPKYKYHDDFFNEETNNLRDEIKELNVQNKPILLYLPTWGKNTSINDFAEKVGELKSDYFIVIKAHHCTWRHESEAHNLMLLKKNSDLLLAGNYDFYSVAKVGDYAICDATSNSATEIPYINNDIRLAIIMPKQVDKNLYIDEIGRFAEIIKEPDEVHKKIDLLRHGDAFMEERLKMLKYLYCEDKGLIDELATEIKKYKSSDRNK